jgi:hypothetical protein
MQTTMTIRIGTSTFLDEAPAWVTLLHLESACLSNYEQQLTTRDAHWCK